MALNLTKIIIRTLQKKRMKISIAESCTGGMLSSQITSVSGSSRVFNLGIISYSNESKTKTLKISKKIIQKYGAVSKECCILMARNIKNISNSSISLSITGIAGPRGGTLKKPVGLVYIGLSITGKTHFKKYLFNSNLTRQQIQKKTCKKALEFIKEFI